MKSKKRHQSSSEDSEESEEHQSSSSDSESDDSSVSDHRYKKKKKRERGSSDSDSDSEQGQRRPKKRKHKKKKKKHAKRKRRSESAVNSESEEEEAISISDGEVSPKKKHKKHHKHKRSHSSSASEIENEHSQRRLHSVVKERRSSEERERPPPSYYQYHRPASPAEEYVDDREREVMRFYRGSSKERRYQEQYPYDQEHSNGRNPRYDGNHKPPGEYRRPRDESYQPREESRAYNRNYNQFEGAKRREFEEGREYRRGPPEPDRYRQQRDYPERRDRFREEPFHADRSREVRRDKPPPPSRPDRPPPPSHHSTEDRYRNKSQQRPERDERPDRYRDREERSERPRDDRRPEDRRPIDDRRPPDDRRPERRPDDRRPIDERRTNDDRRPERNRPEIKTEPREREKKSRFADADDKEYNWGKDGDKKDGKPAGDKEKPNFGLSGKLTADANTVNGVVIKYTEPDDAKQPKRRWRFYPFKGDKSLPILYIHRQSAFLIGRDKKVCDITLDHPSISKQHAALQYRATPFTREDGSQGRRVRPYVIDLDKSLPILYIHRQSAFLIGRDKKVCDITLDHPSISKQHAALQYRATPFTREDGSQGRRVRPYVIDLESSNGTFVNNKKIEPRRYVELLERDVVKFGFSERDYVLLHENSKDEAQDDDEQPSLGAAVVTTAQIKSEKRIKTELTEDGE